MSLKRISRARSTSTPLKLSYQMSKNNRLVYAWQRGVKAQPQNGGGRIQAARGDARLHESHGYSEGRVAEHGDARACC